LNHEKNTVLYYNGIINKQQQLVLQHRAVNEFLPNIDTQYLNESSSLSDLSSHSAIIPNSWNIMMLMSINELMRTYLKEVASFSIVRKPYQRDLANQILALNEEYRQNTPRNELNTTSFCSIITKKLEDGLEQTDTNDNFPRIVKAIANETNGLPGWEFSQNAIDILNDIEPHVPLSTSYSNREISCSNIIAVEVELSVNSEVISSGTKLTKQNLQKLKTEEHLPVAQLIDSNINNTPRL
jgi:hypothetical protein